MPRGCTRATTRTSSRAPSSSGPWPMSSAWQWPRDGKPDVKPYREEIDNEADPKPSPPRTAPRVGPEYGSERNNRGHPLYATLGAFLRGLVFAVALTIAVFAVKLL